MCVHFSAVLLHQWVTPKRHVLQYSFIVDIMAGLSTWCILLSYKNELVSPMICEGLSKCLVLCANMEVSYYLHLSTAMMRKLYILSTYSRKYFRIIKVKHIYIIVIVYILLLHIAIIIVCSFKVILFVFGSWTSM